MSVDWHIYLLTGGGQADIDPLSELEEAIIALTLTVEAVEGIAGVQESHDDDPPSQGRVL